MVVIEQILTDLSLYAFLTLFQLLDRSLKLIKVLFCDNLPVVIVCFERRYSELANKWVLRFNDLDYGLPLGLCSCLLLSSTLAFVCGLRFILGFSHFKNVYRQTSKSIIGNRKNKPETEQTQTKVTSNAIKSAR